MANEFAGVFGEIGKASVTERSDDVKEGDYLFEVAEIVLFKGNNGPTHKVRLIVREALKKGAEEPSAVGSEVGVVNLLGGKTIKVAPGKIKGFTLALFGLNESDITAEKASELAMESCAASNPCKGFLVRGSTVWWTSRAQVRGLGVNFSPATIPGPKGENSAAKVAARAAAQK